MRWSAGRIRRVAAAFAREAGLVVGSIDGTSPRARLAKYGGGVISEGVGTVKGFGGLRGLGGLGGLVARRELGEDGVEGDGGGGDSRGRAGLGHRLVVAVWARVRAAIGDG